jgi:hypothetical protein
VSCEICEMANEGAKFSGQCQVRVARARDITTILF